MKMRVKYSPKFKAYPIYHKAFGIDWPEFQLHALNTGKILHNLIQSYITANHKRGGATGKLAKAINFQIFSTKAQIFWGIGHIPTLQRTCKGYGGQPYWYMANYGKKFNGQP